MILNDHTEGIKFLNIEIEILKIFLLQKKNTNFSLIYEKEILELQ